MPRQIEKLCKFVPKELTTFLRPQALCEFTIKNLFECLTEDRYYQIILCKQAHEWLGTESALKLEGDSAKLFSEFSLSSTTQREILRLRLSEACDRFATDDFYKILRMNIYPPHNTGRELDSDKPSSTPRRKAQETYAANRLALFGQRPTDDAPPMTFDD